LLKLKVVDDAVKVGKDLLVTFAATVGSACLARALI
jgi:hypothetical protein